MSYFVLAATTTTKLADCIRTLPTVMGLLVGGASGIYITSQGFNQTHSHQETALQKKITPTNLQPTVQKVAFFPSVLHVSEAVPAQTPANM